MWADILDNKTKTLFAVSQFITSIFYFLFYFLHYANFCIWLSSPDHLNDWGWFMIDRIRRQCDKTGRCRVWKFRQFFASAERKKSTYCHKSKGWIRKKKHHKRNKFAFANSLFLQTFDSYGSIKSTTSVNARLQNKHKFISVMSDQRYIRWFLLRPDDEPSGKYFSRSVVKILFLHKKIIKIKFYF